MNFSEKITFWYNRHKRDLPWRKTSDPYLIWLSEIILQQTRIDQGLSYYHAFKKAFPTVRHLASAHEDQVLRLWQGLGYYTRARNLHKAAGQIVELHNEVFPSRYEDILKLPGIGQYTAAAISSIAFGHAKPVVDGNVMRVMSRIYGIDSAMDTAAGMKDVKLRMESLIDKNQPGTFNQAVMEFGALHCKPINPDCTNCIFKADCQAFINNMVDELPRKKGFIKVKKRYFNYLVFIAPDEPQTLFRKRVDKDIWKNLYEFPVIESSKLLSMAALKSHLAQTGLGNHEFEINKNSYDYRHILTHQHLFARFFIIRSNLQKARAMLSLTSHGNVFEVALENINQYGVPRLTERFIKENNITNPSIQL